MTYLYSTDYTDCTDVVESNNIIEIKKAYYFTAVIQYSPDGPVVVTHANNAAVVDSRSFYPTTLFLFVFFSREKSYAHLLTYM